MKSVQEKGDIEGKLDSIKGIHKKKNIYIYREEKWKREKREIMREKTSGILMRSYHKYCRVIYPTQL